MKPIKDIADDLNAGRTTSRELVEQSLSNIEDASGEGQRTFIKVHADAARAAADAHDALRAARYRSLVLLPVSPSRSKTSLTSQVTSRRQDQRS